ncbi:MAG: MFS transporter [Bacillota bacterium]
MKLNDNVTEKNANTKMNFGKWGWTMIIYSLFMYFNYAGWSADGMNIFTSAFAGAHGWDPAVLLSMGTPAGLVGVLGTFVFGNLIMKKGVRFIMVSCLVIMSLVVVWFGHVTSVLQFGIALSLLSFFSSGFGFIAPGTLLTSWFPKKKGLALGWATMGMPFATAVFVPLIAFLFGKFGIGNATNIYAAVFIVLAIIAFFLVKNNPEQIGVSPDNENLSKEELDANLREVESHVSKFTLKNLIRDKEMWLISLGFGALWLVTVGIVVQLVPRLMEIGYSQTSAITLLSAAAICALPGSVLWGWMDMKFGTKKAGMVYGMVYIVTLLLLIFQTSNTVITFITMVFVGMGLGGIKNLITSMIGTVYGRYDFTAANRIIIPISIIVRTMCFVIMGIALTVTKSYTGAYAAFIIVDILAIIIIHFIDPSCKGTVKGTL